MTESNNSVPLLTLWYKPGKTLQGLIAEGKGQAEAIVFAGLLGVVQAWRYYTTSEDSGVGVVLVGAVAAILGLYLFGWLLRNFGRWFGASAKQVDIRTALGWGVLPWIALFGWLTFAIAGVTDPEQLAGLYSFFFFGFMYGYIVLLFSLSAALGLTILKTFLCLVVTSLVSLFPLTFVGQLLFGPASPAQ